MTEVAEKSKTEYIDVTMKDGRTVKFAGKRKMLKEAIFDVSKIEVDGDLVQISKGAVTVRFDFLNGETRNVVPPASLVARFLAHGVEQKFGDETAATAANPLSVEDCVLAIEDLDAVVQKGEWGKGRAAGGGGVAGANMVILAIIEATTESRAAKGKPPITVAEVKALLDKQLAENEGLTRAALYQSYKVPTSRVGVIIKRMQDEKAVKGAKINAEAGLAEIE